jgi:hypothetical protein
MTRPRVTCRRTYELIADLRETVERTRRTVDLSRQILASLPGRGLVPPVKPQPPIRDVTDDLAEALLHAHGLTAEDYDPQLRNLIEQALRRIGQRLAKGMGPEACGGTLHS